MARRIGWRSRRSIVNSSHALAKNKETQYSKLWKRFAKEVWKVRQHICEMLRVISMRANSPDSISDSIHAVESAARVLDPQASKTLTPALNSLEKAGVLKHRALKEAFAKLYGYTSDEQGIRHALLDQNAADVGLEEALFMFGACASFAAYLTEKHRQVKIVES